MTARSIAAFSVVRPPWPPSTTRSRARLAHTVWNSGCSSWYLDATGRNSTLWPDFTWRYRQRTRRFDADRYSLTRSS